MSPWEIQYFKFIENSGKCYIAPHSEMFWYKITYVVRVQAIPLDLSMYTGTIYY